MNEAQHIVVPHLTGTTVAPQDEMGEARLAYLGLVDCQKDARQNFIWSLPPCSLVVPEHGDLIAGTHHVVQHRNNTQVVRRPKVAERAAKAPRIITVESCKSCIT